MDTPDPIELIRRALAANRLLRMLFILSVVVLVGLAIMAVAGRVDWRIALMIAFFNLASWYFAVLLPAVFAPIPGLRSGALERRRRIAEVVSIVAIITIQGLSAAILTTLLNAS